MHGIYMWEFVGVAVAPGTKSSEGRESEEYRRGAEHVVCDGRKMFCGTTSALVFKQ